MYIYIYTYIYILYIYIYIIYRNGVMRQRKIRKKKRLNKMWSLKSLAMLEPAYMQYNISGRQGLF